MQGKREGAPLLVQSREKRVTRAREPNDNILVY